jgi:hypothetical protein
MPDCGLQTDRVQCDLNDRARSGVENPSRDREERFSRYIAVPRAASSGARYGTLGGLKAYMIFLAAKVNTRVLPLSSRSALTEVDHGGLATLAWPYCSTGMRIMLAQA